MGADVPERPIAEEEAAFLAPLGRAAKAVATPFASIAMNVTAPAGRLARAAVLRRAPRPERTLGDLGSTSRRSARASTGGCGSPPSTGAAASG